MKKKILIVDDEPDIRSTLIDLFHMHYPNMVDIDQAEDGQEGFSLAQKNKYDCVVTDLHMPNLDGAGFVRKLRSEKKNYACPVIVLSANPEESLIKEFSYMIMLSKPFNRKDFLDIFTNQLKLGSNNNRISGVVLNSFITEVSNFIAHKAKSKPVFSKVLSTEDQYIENNLCIRAEININGIFNTYIVGLNKKLTAQISKRLLFKKARSTDAALTLLSHVREKLYANYGAKNIKVENVRIFHDDEARKYLTKSLGLFVKIDFNSEEVHIVAVTGRVYGGY